MMEMKITPSTEFIAVAAAVLFVTAVFIWLFFRRRNRAEDMFEYFCADLLKRNGFTEVEVTKGSGDYGADILAQKEGVTYAVQCKCYTGPVGVGAVQEVYAGRDYYDRMVGAVMTNQYFTSPAVKAAEKLKILLWDGGCLEISDGQTVFSLRRL